MPDWPELFAALRQYDVFADDSLRPHSVGGGDIASAWRVDAGTQTIFLKTAAAASIGVFEGEAEGLDELRQAGAVRVPGHIACGTAGFSSFLALEWIVAEPPGESEERLLGRALAAQHRCCKDRFGWHRDNTIGSTPQHNRWSDDWVTFFTDQRLGFQLRLAADKGFGGELQSGGATLLASCGRFFADYRPDSSLLHGDLWGGNWTASGGQPVIFDPAVYYGDRETDIAMTRLFGGFGPAFYRAYEDAWPLPAGHESRLRLYQLYHVLNHLNLFGRSYLGRALALLRELNRIR